MGQTTLGSYMHFCRHCVGDIIPAFAQVIEFFFYLGEDAIEGNNEQLAKVLALGAKMDMLEGFRVSI